MIELFLIAICFAPCSKLVVLSKNVANIIKISFFPFISLASLLTYKALAALISSFGWQSVNFLVYANTSQKY